MSEPLDPRQMLDLIADTRRTTVSRMTRRYSSLLLLWAAAWALGFTVLWFTRDVGGVDAIPTAWGWTVFAVSMVVAIVWSAVVGIRASGDGIKGRSQLQGALYGVAWTIAMIAAYLLLAGLQKNGLSFELASLLYPALYVMLVGLLYLAGGALWRAVPMYVLGCILIATAVTATFFGAPVHYLVYATVGPIAMAVVAALMIWGPLRPSIDDRLDG